MSISTPFNEPLYRSKPRPAIAFDSRAAVLDGALGREVFEALAAEEGFEPVAPTEDSVALVLLGDGEDLLDTIWVPSAHFQFMKIRPDGGWTAVWRDRGTGKSTHYGVIDDEDGLVKYQEWLERLARFATGAPIDAAPRRELEQLLGMLEGLIRNNSNLLEKLDERDRVIAQLEGQVASLQAEIGAKKLNPSRARSIVRTIGLILSGPTLVVGLANQSIDLAEKLIDRPEVQPVIVQCAKTDQALAQIDN